MFYEPGETQYDLKFKLFGIPVRIHPFFWLLTVLLGMGSDARTLISWIVAVVVSITIHEMGHALVLRAYGFYPRIVLYSFGGLTIHDRFTRRLRWFENIFVSGAGPFAGFFFVAVLSVVLYLFYPDVVRAWVSGERLERYIVSYSVTVFVEQLMWINIGWGIFNLLPVFPLDGGQILREVCQRISPVRGFTTMLQISMGFAIALVVLGVMGHQMFLAMMFGWIAFSNYQMMNYRQGY